MKKTLLLLIIFFNIQLFANADKLEITKNKLPFDFAEYGEWHYRYSLGERDDKPYLSVDDFRKTQLSKAYLKKWDNDISCGNFMPFDLKAKQFQLYVAGCSLDKNIPSLIYRIITVNNDTIVDGITGYSSIGEHVMAYPNFFYISEDLKVTVRQDTYDDNEVLVNSKVIKTYKINDKGEFYETK